jgi:hypothetical protein
MPAALRTVAVKDLEDVFAAGARAVRDGIAAVTSVAIDVGPLGDADTPEEVEGHR